MNELTKAKNHCFLARQLASKNRLSGKEIQATQKLLVELSSAYENLIQSIVTENEFTDEMPDDMFSFISESKANAQNTFRYLVKTTKESILMRFDTKSA